MKHLIVATLLMGVGLSSCVSTKKYAALQSDYEQLQDEQKKLDLEKKDLETLRDQLNSSLEAEEGKVSTLSADTTKLRGEIRRKQRAYNDLNETYFLLASKSTETMAKQAEENRILLEDVRNREKKVVELESLISQQEALLSGLKDKLAKALNSFDGKGLTVENRDGKVYVSLENSLLFRSGSWTVDKKGKAALDKLAKILAKQQDINILIEGHTDNIPYNSQGAVKDNWDLSVMRATSIVKILMKTKDIGPERITAAGRSEFVPIAQNSTRDGRAKNRRIDIILSPDLEELNRLLTSESSIEE
jgi:chemotaxis protein MotB